MKSIECYLYLIGILFPIIAYSSILFAISRASWFSWYLNALSDLGVYPASSTIFNLGLITSGFMYCIFSIYLINQYKNYLWRIGVLLLILNATSLMLVGVFPENVKFYHGLFALLYFMLFQVSFILLGFSLVRNSDREFGYMFIIGAIFGLMLWFIPWRSMGIIGIAIPELLASLANTIPLLLFSIKNMKQLNCFET
ncbi:MAG: DUF998 domain-containing protein, partial [Candidatus Njordarchaeum guaymaensis]